MDPTLRSFAVFINSNASLVKSTQKSKVNIPFNGNLATHDPHKMLRVALSQMKFTNSVYNINETNNTLTICAQFAQGRGYDATYAAAYGQPALNQHLWQTWNLRIPKGFYDTTTLANTLSEKGVLYPEQQINEAEYINRVGYESVQQRFEYTLDHSSYNSCFVGFGANPADPADPIITKGVITVENNSKVSFQSSDLSHMVQYGTDLSTACTNILLPGSTKDSTTLDYSMVYRAVHLLYNENSAGLLKLMGYFNIDTIPPMPITGYCDNTGIEQSVLGYSLYFTAGTIETDGSVPAWQNTTFYTFDTTRSNLLTIYPPSFLQDQVTVYGWVVGTNLGQLTPELALLDQPNSDNTDYYEVALGDFLAGSGITQPSPYFSSVQISGTIPLTFISGLQTTLTIPLATWTAASGYGLQVGYPIRINDFGDATDLTVFAVAFMGYYVTAINAAVDPVILTLDHSYTNLGADVVYDCSYRNYVLSRSQIISEVPPLYQIMVVSGDPVSVAAAELRPNTVSNLEGLDEIHVHCPQLRTQHYSSARTQSLAPSDVIAVVPVDVVFGSKQTYNPPVVLDAFLNNTNITNLEFSLTDSNNVLIDFNGVDWSMVLKCEEVDVDTTQQLNQQGFFNTPFQDQLQLLEGTARQEIRAKRGRLPYEFFDSQKSRKT